MKALFIYYFVDLWGWDIFRRRGVNRKRGHWVWNRGFYSCVGGWKQKNLQTMSTFKPAITYLVAIERLAFKSCLDLVFVPWLLQKIMHTKVVACASRDGEEGGSCSVWSVGVGANDLSGERVCLGRTEGRMKLC